MELLDVTDHKINNWSDYLQKAIIEKTAKVGVIGLGYVGLPLAVEKGKVGFDVLGIDQNRSRVARINEGLNYIQDVKGEDVQDLVSDKKLTASYSFDHIEDQDILIICVPTPLSKNREPDISYVENVTKEIAKRLQPGKLIILESTTYPGTTEEVILPLLESTGLKVGQDFFLVYSPERVDPGNKRYTTKNTSKVVGGMTAACLDIAETFYSQTISKVVRASSPSIAEMTKVFENTYRSVNIALVNELMMLCDEMNINVWEVIDAAATKPFGIQTFYPGPGVGGHCIPIDPFYLSWKARQYDFPTRFIELAGEVNIQTSYYVVDKVIEALNDKGKALHNSKILVLGVAYKKDISDYRESPAIKIMKKIQDKGANLVFYDPYVDSIDGLYGSILAVEKVDLNEYELRNSDCVLIITDHSLVNYDEVVEKANLIIDARNATKNVAGNRDKIVLI
ncbi:MAG: nucleotide sugar dehydrogenase [Clostridiales bacterium]|nr:nucleotide sugar dehydrogenase [Clostridiales bacterium]MCF8022784.1 nucleotide sugar dehydrogenase [Clostridiales bacterium]